MDPVTALRAAVRSSLLASAALVTALGGQRVYRQMPEQPPQFPSITYYDFGTGQHVGQGPTAPILFDAVWTFDVWATTPDEAEAIALLVRQKLHQQPLPVAGNEARVESMRWLSGRDDSAEEGDVARKTLAFGMLAYLRT